jgi:hypothetical protein
MEPSIISQRLTEIRRNMITPESRRIYSGSVARFLLWIYNIHPEMMNQSFLSRLSGPINKKTLRDAILNQLDPSCPPISLQDLSIDLFMEWIVTIQAEEVGFGSLNSHRSALFNLFRDYNLQFSTIQSTALKEYFKGLKRQMAFARARSTGRVAAGKDPLQISQLKRICSTLLSSQEKENIFSHFFLLLTWNLMCRSSNTTNIRFNHMIWHEDAMGILFCHSKTDQNGEVPVEPRHLYANPVDPRMCVVLSLGLYWLLFPPDLTSNLLFPGTNQYERFRHCLFTRILESNFQFGTHSIRKGAATYCSSGCIDGPDIAAIYLRAGWKFPGVGDTYIKFQDAGDQYVGRMVSGLPFSTTNFAILPPFFLNPPPEINEALMLAFPTIFSAPEMSHLKTISAFALASLVYHSDFIRMTMHPSHPIVHTPLFRHPTLIRTLKQYVVCRNYQVNDPIVPTGLPSYVILLEETNRLRRDISQMPTALIDRLRRDQVISESSHPTDLLSQRIESLAGRLDQILIQQSSNSSITTSAVEEVEIPAPQAYLWGGRFHAVPEDFVIPNVSLIHIIQSWYFGHPPLKTLAFDDMPNKNMRKRLSDIRFLISTMEVRFGVPHSNQDIVIFASSITDFLCPLNETSDARKRQRRSQFSWRTLVDLARAEKRQRSSLSLP